MAIYDLGTASLSANGEVTGVGTTWKAPLTLIRVGATIVFKTEPVKIYTISEIISDTQINVYNPNSETVPAGTGYAILAHDGITVQGLAQDVAETLRYYQSRETEVADAVDAFNNFDSASFESKVNQVDTQHSEVISASSQVAIDSQSASESATEAQNSAAASQQYAQSAMGSSNEARAAADEVSGALVISFNDGGTVTTRNQSVLLFSGESVYSYHWNGELPKTIPQGSTPESTGGVSSTAWIPSLYKDKTRPEYYGAKGDGVSDDTSAIQLLLDNSEYADLSGNKRWVITSQITIPDRRNINMSGCIIEANIPGGNIFSFNASNFGFSMTGNSGVVRGVANCFLYLNGSSDTPVNSDYVRNVRLNGLNVASTTIQHAIIMNKAVRKVFIDSCDFYTVNGILSNGKSVEITITKSTIFGSVVSHGSNSGIRLTSSGGTRYYSEGWHITDCTIDNFETTIDLSDIFVFTINGGFIATNSGTGYAVAIRGVTTTTHCREIQLRSVFGGKVRFFDSASPSAVISSISGEITNCKPGTCVAIGANTAGVEVYDLRFSASPGCTAISVADNCGNIQLRGLSTDSTLTSGVIFNGETGGGCSISDFSYSGTGVSMSLARPVKLSNVPVDSGSSLFKIRSGYVSASNDVPVSGEIVSTLFTCASSSIINVSMALSLSNVASGNAQYIRISCPSGVVLPSGSSSIQLLVQANGLISASFNCVCQQSFKNLSFAVSNAAGNQLRVITGSSLTVSIVN